MAFVYGDSGAGVLPPSLPTAMTSAEVGRAAKACRARVAEEILKLRDMKLDSACRRAVGVGGRWSAHPLPDQLRWKNYVDTKASGRDPWVESFV